MTRHNFKKKNEPAQIVDERMKEKMVREVSSGAVIDWLLEEENPSVRYFALTELLGEGPDSPVVSKARRAIMERGVVPAILAKRAPDGSWGEPGKFYEDKYGGTAWQILVLAELGADGAHPAVRKSCELLIRSSQESGSGGFSYKGRAKGEGGLPSAVIPCLTGNMAYALYRLGMGADPRVKAAIEWIGRHQRFDDGGHVPAPGDPYARLSECFGGHSCHMGVVKALKALSQVPAAERSRESEAAIAEGVEYLLMHRVHKSSREPTRVPKPGWLKFGFPLMYQTDALEILMILARLGVRDPRTGETLKEVLKARGKDGKWRMANSMNGKMAVDIEKRGEPSKWITLRALWVLKELG
jgi:hypothetical protein